MISSHQYLNYKFLNGEISTFTMGNDILIGLKNLVVFVYKKLAVEGQDKCTRIIKLASGLYKELEWADELDH